MYTYTYIHTYIHADTQQSYTQQADSQQSYAEYFGAHPDRVVSVPHFAMTLAPLYQQRDRRPLLYVHTSTQVFICVVSVPHFAMTLAPLHQQRDRRPLLYIDVDAYTSGYILP